MSLPCNGCGRRSGSVSDVHVISAHEGGSWEVSIDERGRDHAQHDRDLRRIDHGRTPERGLAEHQQRGDDDGGRADADQDLHAVLRRQGDGEGGDRRRQGVGWTGDRRAMARGVDPAGAIGRDQHHLVQIGEPDGDHPPYRLRRGVDERRAQPERPCHLAPVHGGGADGREGKRGGPWACRMAEPAGIVGRLDRQGLFRGSRSRGGQADEQQHAGRHEGANGPHGGGRRPQTGRRRPVRGPAGSGGLTETWRERDRPAIRHSRQEPMLQCQGAVAKVVGNR
ncbi:MAG: hypothetical protein KatS3mg116_3211 [Elioraea sp.]|nr:MAG: hypothetical protein KatS3mg116_3211 [Elioraea sp.]